MKLKISIATLFIATTTVAVHAETVTNANSGFFIASNSTNHTVTIKVGNLMPTRYTISPHSSKTIIVSTNNQNIEISDIS